MPPTQGTTDEVSSKKQYTVTEVLLESIVLIVMLSRLTVP